MKLRKHWSEMTDREIQSWLANPSGDDEARDEYVRQAAAAIRAGWTQKVEASRRMRVPPVETRVIGAHAHGSRLIRRLLDALGRTGVVD